MNPYMFEFNNFYQWRKSNNLFSDYFLKKFSKNYLENSKLYNITIKNSKQLPYFFFKQEDFFEKNDYINSLKYLPPSFKNSFYKLTKKPPLNSKIKLFIKNNKINDYLKYKEKKRNEKNYPFENKNNIKKKLNKNEKNYLLSNFLNIIGIEIFAESEIIKNKLKLPNPEKNQIRLVFLKIKNRGSFGSTEIILYNSKNNFFNILKKKNIKDFLKLKKGKNIFITNNEKDLIIIFIWIIHFYNPDIIWGYEIEKNSIFYIKLRLIKKSIIL